MTTKPRTDAERLEWLICGAGKQAAARVQGSDQRGWSVLDCSNGLIFITRGHKNFRDAIDAAMEIRP